MSAPGKSDRWVRRRPPARDLRDLLLDLLTRLACVRHYNIDPRVTRRLWRLPVDAGGERLSPDPVGSDPATCRLHRCAGARLAVGGGNRRHPRIGCRGSAVVLCRPLDRHRSIEALCFPPRPMADVDARRGRSCRPLVRPLRSLGGSVRAHGPGSPDPDFGARRGQRDAPWSILGLDAHRLGHMDRYPRAGGL